jgi:hypothetical protein
MEGEIVASSLQDRLRAELDEKKRWYDARVAHLAHKAHELEAIGRKVYGDGIRTGRDVIARTPQELQAVARAVIKSQQRAAAPAAKNPPTVRARPAPQRNPTKASPPRPDLIREGQAAVSGAVDELTFGLADRGLAAVEALRDGGADGFVDRYAHEMAAKKAEDDYDAAYHGMARNGGRLAGFVGSVAATGGFGLGGAALKGAAAGARLLGAADKAAGITKVAARAAKAANSSRRIAQLSREGLTTMAVGGGAASGAAGQVISDLASGKPGSAGDYAGAVLGGIAGGLALRAGVRDPRLVGALEGAATTGLQGLANGRDFSAMDIAASARGGAIGGSVGDLIGKYGANALPRKVKGDLGEQLSLLKTLAEGKPDPRYAEAVVGFQERLPGAVGGPGVQREVLLRGGRKTIADHVTHDGSAVEAKFGSSARLSKAQRLARAELLDRYRIDHWLPADIGRASTVGFAGFGAPNVTDREGSPEG